MGSGPRNYTITTIKRLYALSGNFCAFPECPKRLVNPSNAKDSNICHIEAANEGGERYNKDMTDEQRADYDNLILLCVQHHDETNNVEKYSVETLKQMKKNHENKHLSEQFKKNPSMLKNTILALANVDIDNYPDSIGFNVVDPGKKIEFNMMKKNASLIKEYSVYHTKLNALYAELEDQGSIIKDKLLRTIKLTYDKVKSAFVNGEPDWFSIVSLNSDVIFDEVYAKLYEKLESSDTWDEDVMLGLNIVMTDAFIRCKILEEPIS